MIKVEEYMFLTELVYLYDINIDYFLPRIPLPYSKTHNFDAILYCFKKYAATSTPTLPCI